MVSWFYFEGIDALRKWLGEVIRVHKELHHKEEVEEYSRVLEIANEFGSYIYSRRCFAYMLVICDRTRLIAMCRDGEFIRPVDVEEWLEYADL
jgi:hypothetical protein